MIKSLFFLLGNKKKKYLVLTSILILILLYDVVPALIVGNIVDFFTTYTKGQTLAPFYEYTGLLGISWAIVSLIRLSTKRRLSLLQSEVHYETRVKGFERLLDFSIKWHDNENTGNKVQKIQNGTDAVRDLQKLLNGDIFPKLTQIIGVLVVLSFLRLSFLIYCLVYIGIFLYLNAKFSKRLSALTEENNLFQEKASGTYYEGLSNVLTIKTLGVKGDFKKGVQSREESSRDFSFKRIILINNRWRFFQIVNGVALGGIVFFSGQSFLAGAITIGSIFIIFNYFQKLSGALGDYSEYVDRLIQNKVSISRMMPIFLESEAFEGGNKEFPKEWDALKFSNAHFVYTGTTNEGQSKPDVPGLSALSVTIKKYEKIGVVGSSGSGKSTFAKVLLGLYKIDKGEFKIGENNFYDLKHDEVTKRIALVLQDSEMFNLTLRDNITLMRKLDDRLLMQAIEISQLNDLIEKLPEGLDTMIGEKGYRLSGGERQRLGIARAIYKDPEVLVLDEATSSLDSKTETLILRALEVRLTKKTVISIAHRISTLKNTDRVIVFDGGTVVEEGTYNQLSKDTTSKFYEISHIQK